MCLNELCADSPTLGRAIERADPRLLELGTQFSRHVAKGHYGRARQVRARILKHIDESAAWGPTRANIADYVRDHAGSNWIGDDDDCNHPDPDVCQLDYAECDFEGCLTHHADEDDKTDDEDEDENCVDPYCAIHHDPNTADAAPGSQLDDDADETDDEDEDADENCVDPYCAIHGTESA